MQRKKKAMKPKFQTYYHQKVGPHLEEVDPSSKDWSDNMSCFIYIIAREEIEACDPRRLLHDLRTELDNPFYSSGPGNVCFSVEGDDEDPRDLLMIPEFRSFVRKVQELSPCWLYFAMPGSGWLRIILAAGATAFRYVVQDGQSLIDISQDEITGFMQPQIKEYIRLCKMMNVDLDVIEEHLHGAMEDITPGVWPWS